MTFDLTEDVRVLLPQAALRVVFDECDGFDQDETGGRVIGTYKEEGGKLTLHVTGIIEPGPQATRSAVSFFQDGEHQERVFRRIETGHPEIEHLGNWHTHHVNGLSTLSNGDIETYRRTVNHHNHNTAFFYALLVVARRNTTDRLQRYSVKHYLLRRQDDRVYEIAPRMVEIVEVPLLWPAERAVSAKHGHQAIPEKTGSLPQRVYDRDILSEFFQEVRPFSSPKLGVYWRGLVELLDGSKVEVVVLENLVSGIATYTVALRGTPATLKAAADELAKREFTSARAALIVTERTCNGALYHYRSTVQETKSSS